MRARYAAYALGIYDFILDTTHPDSPHHQHDRSAWKASVAAFGNNTRFLRLIVHEHTEQAEEAWVAFTAQLEQAGERRDLIERSRFIKVGDFWMYFSGT